MLNSYEGQQSEYLSVDCVLETDDAVNHHIKYLKSLNLTGFPPHKLLLKIEVKVILLRNLNFEDSLIVPHYRGNNFDWMLQRQNSVYT